jgi:hypothetical protein
LIGLFCVVALTLASVAVAKNVTSGSGKSSSSSHRRRAGGSASGPVAHFYLPGAHGYKVSVVAAVQGPGSPVRIVAENLKGSAEYQVPGTVTPYKIDASFGRLGRVSLRFNPSGRVLHSLNEGGGCSLHAKSRLGTFRGVFRFRGEHGYTAVDIHRVRGAVGSPIAPVNEREQEKIGCQNVSHTYIVPLKRIQHASLDQIQRLLSEGPEENSTPGLGIFGASVTASEATLFFTWSFSLHHPEEEGAQSDSCFFMALNEETNGRIAIAHMVSQGGPVSQCPYDESSGAFSVSPDKPFYGTASFQRNPDGSTSWLGSLSVPMHGRDVVHLAGPGFKSELVKR